MRVALWSTSFLKSMGGAEKIVHDLLNYWDDWGLSTFLIADQPDCGRGEAPYFPPLRPGVTIYQNTFPNPLRYTAKPLLFCRKIAQYLSAAIGFGWFVHRRQIQIMHLHFVNIDVLLLVLYKWLFAYRLVITFTGQELELAQRSRLSRFKLALALRAADAVTAVSEDICARLRRVSDTPVRCIHNGIKVAEINAVAGNRRVQVEDDHFVYCGRLTPVKRVPFLLRAFRECLRRGCPKQLYLVGTGEEVASVSRLIRQLDLDKHVFLVGALPHADTMAIIRRSRCLVLVSASEGLPLVILEAMALGKPVIASAVGGIPEIVVHGENGWLFPADSPGSLCDLMMAIAQDKDLAVRMGEQAVQTITRHFRFETMAQQYLKIYQDLVCQPRGV